MIHPIDPHDDAFLEQTSYSMDDLLSIMAFLRSDRGCPWDREQSHESIQKNMIEEAYEAVDAIQSHSDDLLVEELGDVLLQVIFHAQMAAEDGRFDFGDVVTGISKKLISRHTHLFGDDRAETPEAVLDTWVRNKNREKGYQSAAERLDAVPEGMPALMRAHKIQKRAADVGFDWPDPSGAREKIFEELDELDAELAREGERAEGDGPAFEEAGDLLFAVVNYLRLNKIDSETALSRCSGKFIRRFRLMETLARADGLALDAELPLEVLDRYWEAAKRKQREDASCD